MSYVDTKAEALEKRREVKASGKCSCYTKLLQGGYYVGDCPRPLCKEVRQKKLDKRRSLKNDEEI